MMYANHTLAICIPTFKRPISTSSLLASLTNLGFTSNPDVSIHIFDNCRRESPDSFYCAWKGAYPSVNYSDNAEGNLGYTYNFCRCTGVRNAEYIWILGSDDVPVINCESLMTLLTGHDLLTQFDCDFDSRLAKIKSPVQNLEFFLSVAFEVPFGWLSSTIVSSELLRSAIQQIGLERLLASGNNPQFFVYAVASINSKRFLAFPSNLPFVRENRILAEAYIALEDDIKVLSLDSFKLFSRWSINWAVTAISFLDYIKDSPFEASFKSALWRAIVLRNSGIFTRINRYNPTSLFSRITSVSFAAVFKPIQSLKFVLSLIQSPFSKLGYLWLAFLVRIPNSYIYSKLFSNSLIVPSKIQYRILEALRSDPDFNA